MANKFKEIQAWLESEHARLNEELESKLGEGGVKQRESSQAGKMEEAAIESLELESQLAIVQHLRDQLAEVEHALEKLAEGTYGLCDSCGKPIPLARLEAIPQANLCLECKSRQKTR